MKREKGQEVLSRTARSPAFRSGSVLVSVARGQFALFSRSFRALSGRFGLGNRRGSLFAARPSGDLRGRSGLGNHRSLSGCALCLWLLFLALRLQLAASFDHSIGDLGAQQANRADSIIVRWNGIVHLIGVAVSIGQRDHRDLQAAGLQHGGALFACINNKDRVRQAAHIFNTAEGALQAVHIILKPLDLFLWQALEIATLAPGLKLAQIANTGLNGLEVGEHTTEPALIDVEHPAALRFFGHGLLGLLLCSYEENGAALAGKLLDEFVCLVETGHRLLEINNVNAVAIHKDERLHFGVPAARLVTKMDASFKKLFH